MIADLFLTTRNRHKLLWETLQSLKESTPREQYRLTVVLDGLEPKDQTFDLVSSLTRHGDIDHLIVSQKNEGLGPSFNKAIPFITGLKGWDGGPALTCYVQDDVLFAKDWLRKLSEKYLQLQPSLRLSFASGHGAMEHRNDFRAETKLLGPGMYTNKYIRATCMLAYHDFFASMMPIPKVDPETGQERGRPHNGLGSGVDWHFVRVHTHSVVRSGRTNLIMPGLVIHNGYKASTWLKQELPEDIEDIEKMPRPPVYTPKQCGSLFGPPHECKNMTDGKDWLCKECRQMFNEEPDAYK